VVRGPTEAPHIGDAIAASLAGSVMMVPLPYQAIAKYERGAVEPGWPTVLKLADALGVTPDTFLDHPAVEVSDQGGEEEPPRPRRRKRK
jgi:transcriptional regulator with XRE-family HTH domain